MCGRGTMLAALLALAWGAQAAAQTDVHAMFDQAERDGRVGLARKTKAGRRAAGATRRGRGHGDRRRGQGDAKPAGAAGRHGGAQPLPGDRQRGDPGQRRQVRRALRGPARAGRCAPAGSRTVRAASRWPISWYAPPMARSPSPRPGASRWWRALAMPSCATRATRRTPTGSPQPRSRAPTRSCGRRPREAASVD